MIPGTGKILSFLAVAGMALPLNAISASEQKLTDHSGVAARTITDVSLNAQGDLVGAVVQKDGRPIQGQAVLVMSNQQVVATAKTDAKGVYRIKGLRNGLHVVRVSSGEQACRLWSAPMAPPNAKRGLITARDTKIVRGQGGDFYEFDSGKLLGLAIFGGATAATLITTLGADDDGDSLVGVSGAGSGSGAGAGGNPASP